MNDYFELSTNSKTYKFLHFCSNFFLTSWLVPCYDSTTHLRCLDSVCSLFRTLIFVIMYLFLCSVITFYAIKTATIFDPLELINPNPFMVMGFLFKFIAGILLGVISIFIICAYLSLFVNKIFELIAIKTPNKPYFKLVQTYFKDKSIGLCRRVTVVDTVKKKE